MRLAPPRTLVPRLLVVAVVLAVVLPSAGAAQDDVSALASDRPGIGDGAAVMAPGAFQIEAGAAVLARGGTSLALGQGLMRLGLPGFEVRVYPNSYVVRGPAEGLQDLGVGVKIPVRRGDRRMAVVAGATVPTGSDGASADEPTLFGTAVWEWPVSARVGLNVNAGYGFPLDDVADGSVLLTVTPGVTIDEANGISAYGGLAALLGNGDDVLLEAGLARVLGPDLQVDLNTGLSLNDGQSFVGIGVSRRWR